MKLKEYIQTCVPLCALYGTYKEDNSVYSTSRISVTIWVANLITLQDRRKNVQNKSQVVLSPK